jgi:hypothetical protein
MGSVCIGVDIGQKVDPTAIAVVEVAERADATYFVVRHLERLPLGTAYPLVATRLAVLVKQVRKRMGAGGDALTIFADATGVGLPVVDLLKDAGIPVTPVLFTHGDKRTEDREQRRITLGKAWLVSRLQALLQSGRLLLPDTTEARALAQELLDYEIRLSEDADFKAGAFKVGSHDDLVTALGLATQVEPVVMSVSATTWVPAPAVATTPFDVASQLLTGYRARRAEEQRQEAQAQQGLPPEAPEPEEDDSSALAIGTAGAFGNPHDSSSIIDRLLGRHR